MQNKSAGTLKGCDLSHHHADIKITSVSGDIVYLKATEGQHTKDPAFDDFYVQCKTVGKKIGAYHFLHIGSDYTVESQVENAAAAVNGKEIDCLFGIDIEDGGYHGGTPDEVTTQILRFADLFTAKTNIPCCVYASTAFIKAHFKPEIKRLPLWVAYYGVDTPGDNGIWDSWTGFQYTDKPYDLDVFMQDILINRETAANRIVKSVMPALASSDVYAVSSLPCDWNATAGANFDVRSSDGTAVSSRQIFKGDKMLVWLSKRGIVNASTLKKAETGITLAQALAAAIKPFLPGYADNVVDAVLKYAQEAVQRAENTYKVALETDSNANDNRSAEAENWIKGNLSMEGIQITPEIQKLIDAVTPLFIRALPPTHKSTATAQ